MKTLNKILLLFVLLLLHTTLFAQTIESSIGFQTDFEDEEERGKWILNPGLYGSKCANQWFWGSLGANGGDYGLFISGDQGATNSYEPIGTTVLAYRTFTFDKGDYELSFDWQAGGLSTDGLYVCWIPERDSIKLNSVSTSSMLPDWVERYAIDFNIDSDFPYLSQRTWNSILDTVYTNGAAYNLVFVWNNSVLASYSLGAMVDNLNILEVGRCSRPTNLIASPKGTDMVLSWVGQADAYDVRCVNNLTGESVEYNDVTTTYQVISDLPEGMCTYFVRSKCGGIAGAWTSISKFLFYPGTRCVDYLDLNARNCSYGSLNTAVEKGVVDFGCQAIESRHTIHWNPNEYDPFTLGKLKTIPEGELASIRLGNWDINAENESVEYGFIVDSTDAAVLLLKYAVVLESPGHDEKDQPRFTLEITHNGKPLDKFGCGEAYFSSGYNTDGWTPFVGTNSDGLYKDWTTVGINLREYHGKVLKIKLVTYDCNAGGHFGYAYFTLGCSNGKIQGLSCGGDPETIFRAPEGFNYRWYLPSEPEKTLSTAQEIKLPANDTLTYALDVIQPTNKNCYYTLYASAVGRYPCAAADYKINSNECKNEVEFINKSYIRRVNQQTNESSETDEPCESYLWDFGDGTISNEVNPVHVYPEEGGRYTITLYSGIAEGKCKDDTTFTIDLPRMGLYRDTIHATVCLGESYEFKGETLWESGYYSDTALTIYGCDSIAVLNLYVAESYDTLVVDSVCSGVDYYLGDKLLTESGRYKETLQSIYGCDSTVTLDLLVLETLDIRVDSVVNQCKDDEYIALPYTLRSGGLGDFKVFFDDIDLECEGYSVEENALLLEMPKDLKPDKYITTIYFGERSCGKEHETIMLNLLYPKEVIVQRWGDVLAVTNEDYNGGYEFVAFQWYKNGQIVEGSTSSIFYESSGLDLNAEYSVMLTRGNDSVMLMTCSADLVDFANNEEKKVIVFSKSDNTIDVETPEKARVKIWSTSGLLIKEIFMKEGVNVVDMLGMKGVYIIEFIFENNQREIQQIVI